MSEAEEVGAAFAAMVSTTSGSPVTLSRAPRSLSGGYWARIWGVELDGAPPPFNRPMVLRVMPDRPAGLREAVVQRTIADTGFPTPRVLASGVAPGLGESYIVMEHVAGRTPIGGLRLGPELLGIPKLLRRLPAMLASTATALHAINPALLRAALTEAGIEPGASGHPFRPAIETAALECPSAGFDEFVRWLDKHAPNPGPDVICHGDLHPLNMLLDDHGGTSLLDWTTATIAPREMDIGLSAGLLRCAPMDVPKPLRPVIRRITDRLAESFITTSIRTAGTTAMVDRGAVDWWEALQHGRCLAELARGRLHPGGVVGPGHPFETSVDAMRRRLRQLTGVTITPPARVSAQRCSANDGR